MRSENGKAIKIMGKCLLEPAANSANILRRTGQDSEHGQGNTDTDTDTDTDMALGGSLRLEMMCTAIALFLKKKVPYQKAKYKGPAPNDPDWILDPNPQSPKESQAKT
ncbi:GL19605 [Drosophila persimilis]|uniref:GL19605 n=1 Tax=Drosophila persimilis TaxID=7234 RepID=B4G7C3_DROPE|nr:GL19605 [Drosophila persimilis]